ncbi:MAG: contact-dependent growth inhibition system immunity protein [Pseudomonadota bacterium]
MTSTDLNLTLEQLTGMNVGDPDDPDNAPTSLVADIYRSWKKPLNQLDEDEIGRLIVQKDGFPYILDLVWPKLRADPLFCGGYYEGDVLANLIKADDDCWTGRENFRDELEGLFDQAMKRPHYVKDMFMEVLGVDEGSSFPS